MEADLTPLQRLLLAFVAFFYVLANRRFAQEVNLLRERQRAALPPGETSEGAAPGPGVEAEAPPPPHPPGEAVTQEPSPLREGKRQEEKAAEAPAPKPPDHAEALHVLSLLQRDGRLLDFVSESLEGFSDSEIGAAARTVHAGCRKVVESYLQLEPVYREPEGASVTVALGFDPAAVRLTGNVVGTPPFKGSLKHHGWRVVRATFPPPGEHPQILAPAEVEL
jgi:hypothetical protein